MSGVGRFEYDALDDDEEDPERAGVDAAIENRGGDVPDLLVDEGGHGHVAVIRLLGFNPKEVVGKLRMVINELAE